MKTAYLTHPVCGLHANAPSHPEQPARIARIHKHFENRGLMERMAVVEPARASIRQLHRAHGESMVARVFDARPGEGWVNIDADTGMNAHSLGAALYAAGAVVTATDRILAGEAEAAFCNVRPPGHHAERDSSMGFCLFNNIAVGVLHALEAHGLERAAVVDFDVHHGNGTEDILRGDRRTLMCSTFQWPLYPGRQGAMEPGHMVNVPLVAGAGRSELRAAVEEYWLPALKAFRPQMMFISAGFDAHRLDPLASLSFTADDYRWLTAILVKLMRELGEPRIVSSLEGGYHLEALADSASAHVEALLEG